ncbi:helix-turn-helix domain-containing protein [Streptomyces sp. NPDC085946]|uniref:helix-turn-helix domain-containing protein n=1 Tax=Streptomyces sp. NPDC085946 TaxID=3365744 RepID=UPI0037CFBBA9
MLSDEERAELLCWAGGAVAPRLVERARIVLACADGKPNTRVAAECKVTADTVRKWRSRFAARRMAGLADQPRPGRRKAELVFGDDERAQLMRLARSCSGSSPAPAARSASPASWGRRRPRT